MFSDYEALLMDKDAKSANDESQEPSRFQRVDSFRKVLPSKPSASADSRLSMSMKMVKRPETDEAERRGKLYAHYFLEYSLMCEFEIFQKHEILGLYVSPADKDPLVWYGVLFVHDGPYTGGIFRFQLLFPVNFPEGPCPSVIFDEDIFHPAINPDSRELNVSAEFAEWRQNVNQVWQVLHYVKSVFLNVEASNAVNEDAAALLLNDPAEFNVKAQSCVMISRQSLFLPPKDDDANYITFDMGDEV